MNQYEVVLAPEPHCDPRYAFWNTFIVEADHYKVHENAVTFRIALAFDNLDVATYPMRILRSIKLVKQKDDVT